MPVRDIVLTVVILGSLPICFLRPWIGVLMWNWIGIMAPQWLVWGFARSIPFAQLVAGVTLPGLLLTKDRQPLPRTREVLLLWCIWLWFGVTTFFAMLPGLAFEQFFAFSKSLAFVMISLLLFQDRARLRYLLLLTAGSIGFYGFKGGVSALRTGAALDLHLHSGLGGNTAFGLGLVMTLPLLFYLAAEERRHWLRWTLRAAFAFCIVATVFTYSRGALLGLIAVLSILIVKLHRPMAVLAVAAAASVAFSAAPESFFHRARTIVEYEADVSAMSRLVAWTVSFRLARDHPILGGGFGAIDTEEVFRRYVKIYEYVPISEKSWNAHSIWFNVLGEHGFVGLALFIALIASCWLCLRRLRRTRNGQAPQQWVKSYSHMLEVALLGYVISGTFLSVAYLELFYQLVGAIILLRAIAERESREAGTAAPTTRSAPVTARDPHVWNRRLR